MSWDDYQAQEKKRKIILDKFLQCKINKKMPDLELQGLFVVPSVRRLSQPEKETLLHAVTKIIKHANLYAYYCMPMATTEIYLKASQIRHLIVHNSQTNTLPSSYNFGNVSYLIIQTLFSYGIFKQTQTCITANTETYLFLKCTVVEFQIQFSSGQG